MYNMPILPSASGISRMYLNILYHKIGFVQQKAINHALFQFIFSITRTPLSVQYWEVEGGLGIGEAGPGIIADWRYSSCVDSTAIKIELWPAQNISFHCKHRPGLVISGEIWQWENSCHRHLLRDKFKLDSDSIWTSLVVKWEFGVGLERLWKEDGRYFPNTRCLDNGVFEVFSYGWVAGPYIMSYCGHNILGFGSL